MDKIEKGDLFDKLMYLASEFDFEFVISEEDTEQDKEVEYFVISLVDKQIVVK